MAAEQARAEIEARIALLYEAANRDDYDTVGSLYTQDATVMPHADKVAQGNQAVKAVLQKLLPGLKKLHNEKTFYFELLNDTTAYTNDYVVSLDENNKPKARFKDCLLWRKVNGVWCIARDFYNVEPMPQEKAP